MSDWNTLCLTNVHALIYESMQYLIGYGHVTGDVTETDPLVNRLAAVNANITILLEKLEPTIYSE